MPQKCDVGNDINYYFMKKICDKFLKQTFLQICRTSPVVRSVLLSKFQSVRPVSSLTNNPIKPVDINTSLLNELELDKLYKKVELEMRGIDPARLTGSTCDTYLEYIQRNLPEGCALKVTKVECQSIPEHIKPPTE
ncbi:unnamed protein product [Leptidea sinapis]|uniref:Ribosomal protein S10 domain-containing protein n=1 Tax=Leptidea sinapis TaxID=189913 RepID=A0A5E4QC14_9NEOP|nr:unnamed protein product [Leptidea sinapis]